MRLKLILLTLLFLFCGLTVQAKNKFVGWAQSGSTLRTSGVVSSDKALKIYGSSTISIYQIGTTTLLSLYSDDGVTPKANPFTANSDGSFTFYTDNSVVDVRVSGSGITPFTFSLGTATPIGTADNTRVPPLTGSRYVIANGYSDDLDVALAAAEAALGASKGTIIWYGDGILSAPVTISHHLEFHNGTITLTTQNTSSGAILLSDNTTATAFGFVRIIEPTYNSGGTPAVTIFQAYNDSLSSHTLQANNISVSGFYFQGAQTVYDGGVRSTIAFGNCHNCTATGNTFDNTASLGVEWGGSSASGNYAQDGGAYLNTFIGFPAAAVALVNAKNVNVVGNLFRQAGRVGYGGGGISAIDVEPNLITDYADSHTIVGNTIDYRGGRVSAGNAIVIQNPTGSTLVKNITIAGNTIVGGDTSSATMNMSAGIVVNGKVPQLTIAGNTITRAGQEGIRVAGGGAAPTSINGNHLVSCGGGGIFGMSLADAQNFNVTGNFITVAPGTVGSTSADLVESGASNSNTYQSNDVASLTTVGNSDVVGCNIVASVQVCGRSVPIVAGQPLGTSTLEYAGSFSEVAVSGPQTAVPSAPTVTPTCTVAGAVTCSSAYTFYVVAKDANGGKTTASAAGTTATGPNTLSGTNYLTISWPQASRAASYDVLITNTSTSIALNVVGLSTTVTSLTPAAAYTTPGSNLTGVSTIERANIGAGTPGTGAFTTVSASGPITSTVSTGTAPLVIASTTNVPNLNASLLNGGTFANPGAIGGTTPGAGTFTVLKTAPPVTLATTTPLDLGTSLASGNTLNYTPTQDSTLNIATVPSSQEFALIITTAGASSFTITFGTNFKTTGTLATGVTSGKVFVLKFICNGVVCAEQSRTSGM